MAMIDQQYTQDLTDFIWTSTEFLDRLELLIINDEVRRRRRDPIVMNNCTYMLDISQAYRQEGHIVIRKSQIDPFTNHSKKEICCVHLNTKVDPSIGIQFPISILKTPSGRAAQSVVKCGNFIVSYYDCRITMPRYCDICDTTICKDHLCSTKHIKNVEYIQKKTDFIYNALPIFKNIAMYLAEDYETEMGFVRFNLYEGEYRYDIHKFSFGIQMFKYLKSTNKCYERIADLEVEQCYLTFGINTLFRPTTFPLHVKASPHFITQMGIFDVFSYRYTLMKANHCSICNRFYSHLDTHKKIKKHSDNQCRIVNGILNKRLNFDCIKNICEYL